MSYMENKIKRPTTIQTMQPAELRAAREDMGLTQQQAADRYEISLNAIKQYELGLRRIPGPIRLLTAFFLEKHRKI